MHVLLAGLVSAIAAATIGYFVTNLVFARYRVHTPATYRVYRTRNLLLGAAADVLFGFTFAAFFALVGGIGQMNVGQWFYQGVLFGCGMWMALALPLLLSLAIFVNFHRGVVAGALVSWLLSSIAAGLICAYLLIA